VPLPRRLSPARAAEHPPPSSDRLLEADPATVTRLGATAEPVRLTVRPDLDGTRLTGIEVVIRTSGGGVAGPPAILPARLEIGGTTAMPLGGSEGGQTVDPAPATARGASSRAFATPAAVGAVRALRGAALARVTTRTPAPMARRMEAADVTSARDRLAPGQPLHPTIASRATTSPVTSRTPEKSRSGLRSWVAGRGGALWAVALLLLFAAVRSLRRRRMPYDA